jgi:hypothetical protein
VHVEALGAQIDVYNTIELQVFDQLRFHYKDFLFEFVRTWRRIEMRLLRKMLSKIPASEKVTEGYGFMGLG